MTDSHTITAPRVIAVVGMHRSGTSCLAGSLQKAGLQLGEVHTWNRYNIKGNREKQAIVDLNDEVLAANGGSWDRPPGVCAWSEEQLERARSIITALAGQSELGLPLGFKDPRTLLTLDGWRRAVPQLEFVGVFRNPLAVARSLKQRSSMPPAQAFSLWQAYNRLLLRLSRKHGFPLIDFDVDEAAYGSVVAALAERLGLAGETLGRDPFFDADLRTSQNAPVSAPVPLRARLLHWRLRHRSMPQ